MKKRITKKECTKHGFNSWIKEGSRKVNAMDEHCCLRNNWRKIHKLPMFRLAWKKTVERKHIKIFEEVTCKTNNSVKHEEQLPLIPGLMESILKMEYHGN